MSLAKNMIDKLDNEDIVIVFFMLSIVVLPAVLVTSVMVPNVAITIAVISFLAWAGIRSGYLREEKEDPVEVLNRRYAEGDISESEWEDKIDKLVDTEVKNKQRELVRNE